MYAKPFPQNVVNRASIGLVAVITSIVVISIFLIVVFWRMSPTPGQISKGERMLSVQVNMGEEGDFDKILDEALEAGNETQVLSQDWNELETTPGKFDPQKNYLAIANLYYSARKMPIHLTIRPVHANKKVVPSDLMDKPFDDPHTIKRFKLLIDWIATQIPRVELISLTIGSEVDMFMWGNPQRWEAWTNFYSAVAPYVRGKFSGTLISCETTYAAFIGSDLAHVRKLHEHSDAIGVSYYPMQNKLGGVESPKAVHANFETVVQAIPRKPIIYYQIGYPSSSVLGSSVEQQAAFIKEAFRAWDTQVSRILMLNFQWMHETPTFGVDQYVEYYQYDTPDFRAFLGSLGLQSWSGEPKPAWETLKKEAKARGFGVSE